MVAKNRGISRDLLIYPGETIADLLEERNLTQKELAQRAGVSEAFLSDVIHGKKDISKSLAMGLEYALDIPSSFWLNLQANYDAELLSVEEEETIREEERTVLSVLHEVSAYLRKISIIKDTATQSETIISLRKYFRVSNLEDLGKLVPAGAFRMSEKKPVDPYVLGAWLCICKAQGEKRHVQSGFDSENVSELVDGIKKIMCENKGDPQPPLITLFAKYGIDFSIVHNFRGAPVHGYIARKDDGTYQMALTIRGAFADIFWFSLFHELGHIINGDLNHTGSFIDADYGFQERETAADQFASNTLLNPIDYETFVNKQTLTYQAISTFANTQGVPPFVVIGRLQKEERILWNRFAKYKPRYKWAEA